MEFACLVKMLELQLLVFNAQTMLLMQPKELVLVVMVILIQFFVGNAIVIIIMDLTV